MARTFGPKDSDDFVAGYDDQGRFVVGYDGRGRPIFGHDYGADRDGARVALPWELQARALVRLPEVIFIGGYCSNAELTSGWAYELVFHVDRLLLISQRDRAALAEIAYAGIREIVIGGPGLVKSGGGFIGGGFGLAGAAEGAGIAAVLNALTTRTAIKTILQIQAADGELFFLHREMVPQDLRIHLSRAIVAIRDAVPSAATMDSGGQAGSVSRLDELERLARLLKEGLLTREEFDQLKATLIAGGLVQACHACKNADGIRRSHGNPRNLTCGSREDGHGPACACVTVPSRELPRILQVRKGQRDGLLRRRRAGWRR
jgi:hypothetical protein